MTVAPDQGLIIVNCSRSKLDTTTPVPAFDLYQGACVPHLREQFANNLSYRARVRILSAKHGLLQANNLITPYDLRLATRADAQRLHERLVADQVDAEFAANPTVRRVLVIVEPLYLLALRRLFDHVVGLAEVVVIPDPWAWLDALAHLRRWGWA